VPISAGQTTYVNPPPIDKSQPIDASKIQGGSTPINYTAPPAYNPTDLSTIPTAPTQESIVAASQAEANPAQDKQNGIISTLSNLYGQMTGKTAAQQQAEAAANLPQYNQQLNDINSQIQTLQKQSAAAQIQSEDRLAPSFAISGEQQQIQHQSAIKALGLSAIAQTLQGNIALAKDQADRAVAAQFGPIQDQIDYQTKMLELNKDNLSRADKQRADLLAAKLADQQKLVDQAKQDKQTQLSWAAEAAKNGADSMTINKALAAPDAKTALGILGNYLSNPIEKAQALATLKNTQLAGQEIQARTQKALADAAKARTAEQISNIDIPALIGGIQNPNETRTELGGLTVNGLKQKAMAYLANNGNIQGLGLSGSGDVAKQRGLIANYGGYLADKLGMNVPQITALYKANTSAASQIVQRVAKIDATAGSLTTQFPRLAQLANQVNTSGFTESDVNAGKAAIERKFGNTPAANYLELIQTVRSDYASLQAAVAGSRGGQYFAQSASDAIPVGLSGDQYLGIMQTLQQSAQNANDATSQEAQKLIGGALGGAGSSATPTKTGSLPNGTKVTMYSDGSIKDAQGNSYDANGNKI
jgi:hypothetical protein